MVLDYSERKTAARNNRPKKQPIGLFAFTVIGAVAVSFAVGLLSGWLIFRPKKIAVSPAASVQRDNQAAPAATSPGTAAAPAPPQRGQDPPLTFYETLSKGNSNALIGSGLNPKKIAETAPPKPVAPPPTPPAEAKKPASLPATADKKAPPLPTPAAASDSNKKLAEEGKAPSQKTAANPVKYTVQVASSRDRKEAETIVARLVEKGLAAYVSESKTGDRGTWYRVRIGKHLDQQSAADLATRAGKGAMAITE